MESNLISRPSLRLRRAWPAADTADQIRRDNRERPPQPLANFIDPDPVRWIQNHFYIPETKRPLELRPYQIAVLRKALTPGVDGLFPYSIVLWGDVKKSAKSTVAAAVALWRACQIDWGQIVIVANDLKQADSRVGYYIRRAIELHPTLGENIKIIRNEIKLPNRTLIESVAIDPSGEAGGNADMVVYSELWGAHEEAKKRMWTETTLPPGKFGKSFRWVETYAGYSGESVLLEGLYLQAKQEGKPINVFEGVDTWEVRSARMLAMWNTLGRMPWHTNDYYAQEEAVLLANEFLRVHKNQWVSSEDIFVPIEWWDACKGEIPDYAGESMVIALDAAVSGDSFAIVGLTRHPADYSTAIVRYSRRWMPPKGGKIDFQGTEEDPGPELELRRLIDNYNVVQVAYDPTQLEDMAGRLGKEGLAWFRPFTQASERLVADSELRIKIRERTMLHGGDPHLRDHIQNANAKVDEEEHKIRLIKRSELLKIDLAVALSMGTKETMRLNL